MRRDYVQDHFRLHIQGVHLCPDVPFGFSCHPSTTGMGGYATLEFRCQSCVWDCRDIVPSGMWFGDVGERCLVDSWDEMTLDR